MIVSKEMTFAPHFSDIFMSRVSSEHMLHNWVDQTW